jgi:hypothetical protein
MKASPSSGEPGESPSLGNAPRPVAARSAMRPGPSVSEQAVKIELLEMDSWAGAVEELKA